MTPFDFWNGRKPDVRHLHVFSSKSWYRLAPENQDGKLGDCAREAMMIGYASGLHECERWDVIDNLVVVSRNVCFNELENTERARNEKNDHL